MSANIAICYCTARRNSRVEWAVAALQRQLSEPRHLDLNVQFIIISHHSDLPLPTIPSRLSRFRFLQPMPNPWTGPFRVTRSDCFSPAVFRNTALCAADAPYIALLDDLSVPQPTWLDAVRNSMDHGRVTAGAYRKVKQLKVVDGIAESYEDYPPGTDNRLAHTNGLPIQCGGNWMYTASIAMPVEVLISVGGYCAEISGAMGFEDVLTGIALQNAGHPCWYDPKMLTLESEEAHFEEKPFFKTDKGVSPQDKSHAALRMVQNGMKYFENAMPPGGLRKVREDFLAGKGWPWPHPHAVQPRNDWFDNQPLSEVG